MNIQKALVVIFCFILACAVFLPAARAGQSDQMTKFTFSEPVEIPGGVLAAGTYWFVLQHNDSDLNIVQIFSSDWSKVFATIMTVSTYRPQSTNDTEMKFAERPHQRPEALLKWYYPGRLSGHEFVYSRKHEKEFARDAKRDVITAPLNLSSNTVTVAPRS